RDAGATAQTALRGRFSDGSLRDLTHDPGTSFDIANSAVASVNAAGIVSAAAEGSTTVVAANGTLTASAQVRVLLTTGAGFVRGEAFDDTRGLPLSGVTATLVVDGGASSAASPVPADE